MTLNDLERPKRTLMQKRRVFRRPPNSQSQYLHKLAAYSLKQLSITNINELVKLFNSRVRNIVKCSANTSKIHNINKIMKSKYPINENIQCIHCVTQ